MELFAAMGISLGWMIIVLLASGAEHGPTQRPLLDPVVTRTHRARTITEMMQDVRDLVRLRRGASVYRARVRVRGRPKEDAVDDAAADLMPRLPSAPNRRVWPADGFSVAIPTTSCSTSMATVGARPRHAHGSHRTSGAGRTNCAVGVAQQACPRHRNC
jgi:hypothetical protein